MGLGIYESATPTSGFSQDGAMTNPLRQSFNGRSGGVIEVLYYLRNDDAARSYSGITIQPVDYTGRDITDGTDGFSWKLKSGTLQPTEEEWDLVVAGAAMAMSDINNTSTYYPFWAKIEVPAGADVESFEDVVLKILATES